MNTPTSTSQAKTSHKGSITGFVLALVSLALSGIGSLVVRAEYTPSGPTTGSVQAEVGHAVGTGTTSILGAIFGMPLLVGGIVIGLLSIVFVVLRLRKVRVSGLIFSLLAVALVIWSLSIATGTFDLIKADPVN